MIQIYEIGEGNGVLYGIDGSQIIKQEIVANKIGKPVLYAEDYRDFLSGILFQNQIWCVYRNTDGEIVVCNGMEEETKVRIVIKPKRDTILQLQPLLWQGELMIWCDGWCVFPLHRDKDRSFSDDQFILYCVKATYSGDHESENEGDLDEENYRNGNEELLCRCRQDGKFYLVDEKLTWHELQNLEQTGNRNDMHRETDSGQAAEHTWLHEMEALQQENANLQDMLNSAITQYEELMHVAEQYRAEAIKWRSKFVF